MSVSAPVAPDAVDTTAAGATGAGPVRARPAVSPTAPFTQVFCRIKVAEVRVLVIVQVTSPGVRGT